MKKARSVEAVHTHTHTHTTLINSVIAFYTQIKKRKKAK